MILNTLSLSRCNFQSGRRDLMKYGTTLIHGESSVWAHKDQELYKIYWCWNPDIPRGRSIPWPRMPRISHTAAIILAHWGRMTHTSVRKLTIIGSYNSLSPGQRQAIFWTNAGILLIGPSGTNLSEILIKIHIFVFKEMYLKVLSGKWRPFCLGPNRLNGCIKMPLSFMGEDRNYQCQLSIKQSKFIFCIVK